MIGLLCFVLTVLASAFKSKSRLEAENAALRHQLIVLRRKVRGRAQLTNNDRRFFVQLYRWFPSILQVLTIIRPDTLVRWHQAGFRRYWRWKSRTRGGRPQIETELRVLIRRMSVENPLWGAPRIHGELLKLGFELAQSSVAKYMVKLRGPPSQCGPISSARCRERGATTLVSRSRKNAFCRPGRSDGREARGCNTRCPCRRPIKALGELRCKWENSTELALDHGPNGASRLRYCARGLSYSRTQSFHVGFGAL
jgi:hypothetical protein